MESHFFFELLIVFSVLLEYKDAFNLFFVGLLYSTILMNTFIASGNFLVDFFEFSEYIFMS